MIPGGETLRRLLIALSDRSPAFHRQVPQQADKPWRRALESLADGTPAFEWHQARNASRGSFGMQAAVPGPADSALQEGSEPDELDESSELIVTLHDATAARRRQARIVRRLVAANAVLVAAVVVLTVAILVQPSLPAPAEPDNSSAYFAATVSSMHFSPDGHILAVGNVGLFKLSNTAMQPIAHSVAGAANFTFSRDGRTLATLSSAGVDLWDIDNPSSPRLLTLLVPPSRGPFTDVTFSPDGRFLALAGSAYVSVWTVGSLPKAEFIGDFLSKAKSIAFSPDGRLLALAGSAQGTQIWTITDPGILAFRRTLATSANSIAFSPDGHILAGICSGTLCLWDPASGKSLGRAPSAFGVTTSVAFKPDGLLFAANADQSVREWAVDSKPPILAASRQLLPPQAPTIATATSIAISPNGTILAQANDRIVTLWRLADL